MDSEEIGRRLGHVERELLTHSTVLAANAESMKGMLDRSDERLEYIRERFDRVEILIASDRQEIVASRRRIVGAASTLFCTILTACWFVIVEPLHERVAVLERRVLDVEERSLRVSGVSESK